MSKKTLYGEIAKVEDQDDGTIKVWGIASSEAEDSDGETITADAMKAALPDYMKFGAVREMHQPKAAGTALEVEVLDDGQTKLCAHIVDSEAIKKVKTGVYKGFSIGGKVTDRDELKKTTITGLKLTEISLVDRPANPDAVITCYKADGIEPVDESKTATSELGQSATESTPGAGSTKTAADQSPGGAADTLQKSAWSVSRAANLAEDLHGFRNYLEYLSNYDEAPAELIGKAGEMAGEMYNILVELAQFEAARAQAMLTTEKAAGGSDDLRKAGRRNSASDQNALNQILQLVKQLGAADDDGEEGDDTGKLAKVAGSDLVTAHNALLKACGAAGCPESEIAADFVTKLATERATLTKRVKELEAMPEAPKAALKSLEKCDDLGTINPPAVEPVKKADGSVNETATLIKAAFAKPIRITP